MRWKHYVLFFLFALMLNGLHAQRRIVSKAYDTGQNLQRHGFWGGLTVDGLRAPEERIDVHEFGLNTRYNTTYRTSTTKKFGLTAGYFKVLPKGIFRTLDFGVNYRTRSGIQEAVAQRSSGADITFEESIRSEGTFSQKAIAANISPTVVWNIVPRVFIHHGPGVDMEWIVKRNEEQGINILPLETDNSRSGKYFALTYGAGMGLRVSQASYFRLGVRIPIWLPFSNGGTTERQMLDNYYRPYAFSLKYQWMSRQARKSCPGIGGAKRSGRFSTDRNRGANKPW